MNNILFTLLLLLSPIIICILVYKIKSYCNGPKCKLYKKLNGKIIIITGANQGVGRQAAQDLASLGAIIVFACRNEQSTKIEIQKIQNTTQNSNLHFIRLDLSDLESVKQFVQEFKKKFNKIDFLINNAGISFLFDEQRSKQNIEMTIAVNHFGHALLTYLLLSVLKNTRQSRIITVAAEGYKMGDIDYEALQQKMMTRQKYAWFQITTDSKLCNVQFAAYFQLLLEQYQIECKSVSLHPGVLTETNINRYLKQSMLFNIVNCIFTPLAWLTRKDLKYAAQTILYCCLSDFAEISGGKYYKDCKLTDFKKGAVDAQKLNKLRIVTEKILNIDIQTLLDTQQ